MMRGEHGDFSYWMGSLSGGPHLVMFTRQDGGQCAGCRASVEQVAALVGKIEELTGARDDLRREVVHLPPLA
jgi:hypothetical protein